MKNATLTCLVKEVASLRVERSLTKLQRAGISIWSRNLVAIVEVSARQALTGLAAG